MACDDDHTLAWHEGGRTCECNLSPLCRMHHRAKQGAGWQLAQPRPGTLVWTLPSGRTYTTEPEPYPASVYRLTRSIRESLKMLV